MNDFDENYFLFTLNLAKLSSFTLLQCLIVCILHIAMTCFVSVEDSCLPHRRSFLDVKFHVYWSENMCAKMGSHIS